MESKVRSVFFCSKIPSLPFNTDPTPWYTFFLNNDGGYKSLHKVPLSPFSSLVKPALSTIVAMNSTLYSLGGFAPSGCLYVKDVYRFDITNPEEGWVKAPNMTVARLNPSAVVVNDKIYVMGGLVRNVVIKFPDFWAEVFDPVKNSWKPIPDLLLTSLCKGREFDCGLPRDCSIFSAAIGRGEILMSCCTLNDAYIYNVENHSLKLIDNTFQLAHLPLRPTDVGRTLYWYDADACGLVAYDVDENLWLTGFIKGLDKIERNVVPSMWEHQLIMLRMDGLSANAAGGADQLCMIWLGKTTRSNFQYMHCTQIEVSKCFDQGYPILRAFVKSTKSYLVPMGTKILNGLLLEAEEEVVQTLIESVKVPDMFKVVKSRGKSSHSRVASSLGKLIIE